MLNSILSGVLIEGIYPQHTTEKYCGKANDCASAGLVKGRHRLAETSSFVRFQGSKGYAQILHQIVFLSQEKRSSRNSNVLLSKSEA